jgi:hypothetical protein
MPDGIEFGHIKMHGSLVPTDQGMTRRTDRRRSLSTLMQVESTELPLQRQIYSRINTLTCNAYGLNCHFYQFCLRKVLGACVDRAIDLQSGQA